MTAKEPVDTLSKTIRGLLIGPVKAIQIKTVAAGFMAHAMPTAEVARDRTREKMARDGKTSLSLAEVQALTLAESERPVAYARGGTMTECVTNLEAAIARVWQPTPKSRLSTKPQRPKPAANPAVKDQKPRAVRTRKA